MFLYKCVEYKQYVCIEYYVSFQYMKKHHIFYFNVCTYTRFIMGISYIL